MANISGFLSALGRGEGGARDVPREGSKRFFFEKKNQKTFTRFGSENLGKSSELKG
jgi:hypothetical protein